MVDLHLEQIALLTLTLLYGLLAFVTWRAAVIWNGLARSLTAASAALALASAHASIVGQWPVLGHDVVASSIWLLLIVTGMAAIYYIQRETRRVHGAYASAHTKEIAQQSFETGRLADETQRVADETHRVADAAEEQNTTAADANKEEHR